ncbi:hypothetical protein WA026_007584 [Henosepilachna vigintioctopunctata]|uniref:Uncharacterized protein n=1 Tax=Henosepilachna vigintioctopunctata TaxID=420089 RepID=A0AAW1UV44_9CUCU
MGIFNYQKYGFQKQPTDYMWGFFDRIGEALLGNSRSLNVIQCIGPREAYKMLVQYIYDFVTRMTSWRVPYFAFFWSSSLSHDDLNKPRIGDEVYLNLFQNLHENQYFNNTIVIVMSDHGIRFGSFRQTYQGRVEERLPFLFIRIPQEFEEKYPIATSNLKRNALVLTTPFDLHETLVDLASPNNLLDQFILEGRRKSKSKFGLSLFHKIEPTRTCEDAGISDHWCTCLDSSSVGINSEIIQLANFTVNYMNEMLSGYGECENLQLKNVSNAQLLHHKIIVTKEAMKDYLINFQTLPGNGLFEATVRQDGKKSIQVVGSISRLNFYGQQSACITDTHLKLYCYCKNLFGFL